MKRRRIQWPVLAGIVMAFLAFGPTSGVAQITEKKILSEFRNGRIEAVEGRLDAGLNPDMKIDGVPLLTWAIRVGGQPEKSEGGPDPFQVEPPRVLPDAVALVQLLLKKGANVDLADEDSVAPLVAAIEEGELELIEVILKNGPSVDRQDPQGKTALIYAADRGSFGLVTRILDAGADPNLADEDGITPLMMATTSWSLPAGKALLENGADPNQKSKAGEYAAHRLFAEEGIQASRFRETDQTAAEILALLESKGGDLHAQSKSGETPLHRAAAAGGVEAVSFLVERTPDIDRGDQHKRTALHHALIKGRKETVEILLKAGARTNRVAPELGSAVTLAARGFHERSLIELEYLEMLKLTLKNAEGVRASDDKGRTALTWAVASDLPEAVDLLLKAGADVEGASKDGRTPLMWAACADAERTIARLIEHDADPAATDSTGWTALQWARELGQRRAAAALGDPDVAPVDGGEEIAIMAGSEWISSVVVPDTVFPKTPALHLAAEFGFKEKAAALIEAGKDFDELDVNGETALAWAVANGHRDVVELLLKAGADPLKAAPPWSALGWAIRTRRPEVAELLLKTKKPSTGISSAAFLTLAIGSKDPAMLDLLLRNGLDTRLGTYQLDTRDYRGRVHPILAAAKLGDLQILKRLTAKKESVDADEPLVINRGLHLAATWGRLDAVRFFVEELGAEINSRFDRMSDAPFKEPDSPEQRKEPPDPFAVGSDRRSYDFSTPLSAAVNGLHFEVVQYLAGKGAKWEGRMNTSLSMLRWAAGKNSPEMLNLLIEAGLDVNEEDRHGNTPLMNAIFAGPPENVRLLIEAGAVPAASNSEEKTILETAEERGNLEILRLVKEAINGKEAR